MVLKEHILGKEDKQQGHIIGEVLVHLLVLEMQVIKFIGLIIMQFVILQNAVKPIQKTDVEPVRVEIL